MTVKGQYPDSYPGHFSLLESMLAFMYLENIIFDAVDPRRLGTFWETVVGGERLTDEYEGFETRLAIQDGPVIDLCFQRVPERSDKPARLRLGLFGGDHQTATVDRLLRLGAQHLDVGQGDVPRGMLADPEGNHFCVVEGHRDNADTGPIAAFRLDSADPQNDQKFWSWLTGWTDAPVAASGVLRHPSMRGPFLRLCPEPARKGTAKNGLHLDIRLEAGDHPDEVAAGIAERGGGELSPDWGELPWRVYTDPSGNEFCVLPARP